MFEWLNTMEASRVMGTIVGCLLATATLLSILGLIFTAITSVIKTLVAPIEFLAKITEMAAQGVERQVAKKEMERTKPARDAQEASIYNSPFTRF